MDESQAVPKVAQVHRVTDPTGRWRSQVTTPEIPRLHALPGHVRIDLASASHLAAHCFVYEQPMLAGEATAQLLRAISPGLRFMRVSPVEIQALNHAPLIAFSLEFETTLGANEQGEFHIFVLPRLDQSAMCSIEATSGQESPTAMERGRAKHVVMEFLTHLVATAPMNVVRDEVWLLKQAEKTLGFRHLRVEVAGKFHATTTRTSRFSLSQDAVFNRDEVEQELEDEKGLVNMTWLKFTDGRVEFRGQMEFKSGGYRYAMESGGVTSNGRFEVPAPLLGSVRMHSALAGAPALQALDSYLPELRVDGPSTCELVVPGAAAQQQCMSCSAGGETSSAAPASPGLHQALPKATTIWFDVERSHVFHRVEGKAGCAAQTSGEATSSEQVLLLAEEGAWPTH